jgi:hypothetical protein
MADTTATVSTRARKLPIIIVPGTMGSRLTDPATQDLVWNPTGFPISPLKDASELGSFAAKLSRLEQVAQPLTPDDAHEHASASERKKVAHIRHFHTVIRAFYGVLALRLHKDLKVLLAPQGIFPVVYCAGYDFRVDNATSALTLQKVVNEAQQECDGAKVTIIAHSMGGLVTRFFCKNLGGESQVNRVFLLASPTHGAPDAYFTLRNGLDISFVRVLVFGDIFRATDSRSFARKMPSVYQLLPSVLYGRINPTWLSFDPTKTGLSPVAAVPVPIPALQFKDASNSVLTLLDIYTGLNDDPQLRALSGLLYAGATSFDAAMAMPSGRTYMHPNTTVVFCDDLPTAAQGSVRFDGVTNVGSQMVVQSLAADTRLPAGDSTVTAISANPIQTEPPTVLQQRFGGIGHQDIPTAEAVMAFLVNQIAQAP